MAASKVNYVIVYKNDAQVYGSASKEIAMNTPPPEGFDIEDKRVYFISVEPDNDQIVWRRIPHEEVVTYELNYPKATLKKKAKAESIDLPDDFELDFDEPSEPIVTKRTTITEEFLNEY